MKSYDVIGYVASVISVLGFLPQVIKSLKTQRTKDISLPSYLLLLTGVILWALYGIQTWQLPVIVANSIIGTLIFILVILKLRWG